MLENVIQELTADDPNAVMTYAQIINRINEKYGKQIKSSITSHILCVTVNAPARTHYSYNAKPRIIDTATPKRDTLYTIGSGQVVKYDPAKHGFWEIRINPETKKTFILKLETRFEEKTEEQIISSTTFALESHLRDYLAKNLDSIKIGNKKLEFVATEFSTGVGPIDILAKDESGNFYVFELKCSRGTDRALGQIQRYMGWMIAEMARGKQVYGIIVAEKIDEKLKYAIQASKNIELFEYEVNFQLKPLAK